ncbi:MAG: hypothetical protein K0S27_1215 [Gammaproteobacteria bacterium]|jgi:hypothetical protein|nr:hypothetical protein [Gammaproteobacteria bacterium]
MKRMVLVLSIVASTWVLASCANKGIDQSTSMSSDNSSKMANVSAKHHHNYKGEVTSK